MHHSRKLGRYSSSIKQKRVTTKIEKRHKHTGRKKMKDPKNVEEIDEMAEGTYGDTPI